MKRVFIHPLAGVLSAYGMGLADVRRAARSRPSRRRSTRPALAELRSALDGARRAGARASCARRASRRAHRGASGALHLQATTAPTRRSIVPLGAPAPCVPRSSAAYRAALRLPDARAARWSSRRSRSRRVGAGDAGRRAAAPLARRRAAPLGAASRAIAFTRPARWHDAAVYRREDLRAGRRDRRPGDHRARPTRRPSSSRAGAPTVTALDHLVLERVVPRAARARDRHRRPIRCCSRCSTTCS